MATTTRAASTTAPAATGTGRRAGLEPSEIVDAALALVEEHGAEALTMRRLAADLGVTTTTIYWHVGNRDDLVLAIIERVSEQQAQLELSGDDPVERIVAIATHVFRSALERRHVTSLAHQVGATSLLELPLERTMAVELDAAGVRGESARDAMRAIMMCVAGFLVVGMRRPTDIDPRVRSDALWAAVPEDELPAETTTAMGVPADLPVLLDTTLRAIVADVIDRASNPTKEPHG
jgi:TetR/AcrR family transcriptional regulator, tetracycline repressor protein